MTADLRAVGADIGTRLHTLAVSLRRYDGFVFRPGEPAAEPAPDGDVPAAAVALVRRALRVACECEGWRILDRLRAGDATTAQLAVLLGCPRIVAWEQVNELLQAGLVGRDLEGDRVAITAAGRGILDLVEATAAAAAEAVAL